MNSAIVWLHDSNAFPETAVVNPSTLPWSTESKLFELLPRGPADDGSGSGSAAKQPSRSRLFITPSKLSTELAQKNPKLQVRDCGKCVALNIGTAIFAELYCAGVWYPVEKQCYGGAEGFARRCRARLRGPLLSRPVHLAERHVAALVLAVRYVCLPGTAHPVHRLATSRCRVHLAPR